MSGKKKPRVIVLAMIAVGALTSSALFLSRSTAAAAVGAPPEDGARTTAAAFVDEGGSMPVPVGDEVADAVISGNEFHESSPYAAARLRVSRGTVVAVDTQRGVLSIDVGSEAVEMFAPPNTLDWIPGDNVSVASRRYGDREWLLSQVCDAPSSLELQGTVTGTIDRMDRSDGELSIGGLMLRAHPEQLRGLLPGQRASLSFARVGNDLWLNVAADCP